MPRKKVESALEAEKNLGEEWRRLMEQSDTSRLMKIVDMDDSVLDVLVDLDLPTDEESLPPLSLEEFKAVAGEILKSRDIE